MIHVGTSGWAYADWRGRFYPRSVPQKRWLAYYAERFDTVELNATTYRLPSEAHVRAWSESVGPNFAFTVKLSRLITHRKSLPERVDVFVANYMQRIAVFPPGLVAQLLVQFPPSLERDDAHLEAFLDKLPTRHRYVVEFRHHSWHVAAVFSILERRNVALCIHDYPGFRMSDTITASDLAYVRLHGYRALYAGSYPKPVLEGWATRLRDLERRAGSVYAYFNNDTAAAAPRDAARLIARLELDARDQRS